MSKLRIITITVGIVFAIGTMTILFQPFVYAASDNPAFETFSNPFTGSSSAFGKDGNPGGLISLFNNILRVVFVGAGVFAFLNLFFAGFEFVNAQGDPKKIKTAWFKIWQSLVGLIVLVLSFVGAVILGAVLFGDAGAILNITLFGAG